MVQAWMMDKSVENPREPHQRDPPVNVDLKHLEKLGVLYVSMDPNNFEDALSKIVKERGYTYKDQVEICREALPEFDKKLKMFYEEHIHRDEEIRFFIAGSGYFDVRSEKDEWIRIECVAGDLMILPAGIYHRFCPNKQEYCKVNRLFVGEPVWTAYSRGKETDKMKERMDYLKKYNQ